MKVVDGQEVRSITLHGGTEIYGETWEIEKIVVVFEGGQVWFAVHPRRPQFGEVKMYNGCYVQSVEYVPGVADRSPFIDEALKYFERKAKARGVTLEVLLSDEITRIDGVNVPEPSTPLTEKEGDE